jgi:LPS-assembly protein
MDISTASDKDYFSDFGNTLAVTNQSHLEQKINFYTPIGDKKAQIYFLSHQTLDQSIAGTSRPYQLLPRITYDNKWALATFDIDYTTQWSNFYRPDSLIGKRLHFKPSIKHRYKGTAWDVTPKFSIDTTQYALTETDNTTQDISRTLPILSIDNRIYFEKDINKNSMQLLEPRFFYLHVPYQDQRHIPLFDTAKNTFNFDQFYRENIYSGFDRVQSANQLTSSINLKEINLLTGKENFKIQLGIISYFEQQLVPLNTEVLDDSTNSDLLFQWDGHLLNNTSTQYFVQYDPDIKQKIKQSAYILYHNKNKIFNTSWSKEINKEQVSLSTYWPISNHWQIIGRSDYSVKDEQEILKLLGFEYDNCCFQFRINYNRTPKVGSTLYNEQLYNEQLFAQLVFKSLSEPSQGIGKKWQEIIKGYTDPYQQ